MIDGIHAWRLNVVLFSSLLSFYALLCFTVSCLRVHACVLFLSFFPVVFGFLVLALLSLLSFPSFQIVSSEPIIDIVRAIVYLYISISITLADPLPLLSPLLSGTPPLPRFFSIATPHPPKRHTTTHAQSVPRPVPPGKTTLAHTSTYCIWALNRLQATALDTSTYILYIHRSFFVDDITISAGVGWNFFSVLELPLLPLPPITALPRLVPFSNSKFNYLLRQV